MHSIILILPYFGKFNNYFPFFLESCKNNPSVNWLIVTDDDAHYDYPTNVKVLYLTFEQLKQRVQNAFPFQISLETPYKLCDYKPAYGYIFKEEIKNYDFWGHCDNDLIWGDIRSFLSEDILSQNDKIFSRGHLSLYRNNDYINNFFLTSTDGFYKTVYSSKKGFAFDEWGKNGISNHFKRKLPYDKFWDELPFDDLLVTSDVFNPAQKIDRCLRNVVYEYANGELIRLYMHPDTGDKIHKEAVLYVHFQKRPLKIETSNYSDYFIIPNKIVSPFEIKAQNLKKLGGGKLINSQFIRIKIGNLRRKLNI